MTFQDRLNQYMEQLGCSAAELAAEAGLSQTALSRYRSGTRVPEQDSEIMTKLSDAIARLAEEGRQELFAANVYESLNALGAQENRNASPYFAEHFDHLITTLQINLNDLAKTLNFDSSYLSRIRKGQRTPTDLDSFIEGVCRYVVHKYNSPDEMARVATMIGCPKAELEGGRYYQGIVQWLGSEQAGTANQMEGFLKRLDEFQLDEYIRAIHFDDLKVPTVPFQLPASKNYYGIEQMKQGELDFFKSTVLSKSKEPIFMCSDMPMEDMAEDKEFGKKWMFAIAMLLKKGLHLNIIHNINRPFQEMMLGLESWIPIYMTGQVTPYHLKNLSTNIYHHFIYVSGTVALSGECINGYHANGKYYLTNNKEEVVYYKRRAENLLSKASSLMEIYTVDEKKSFQNFLAARSREEGNVSRVLSSLPLETISEELLLRILNRTEAGEEKEKILRYAREQKEQLQDVLKKNEVTDNIPVISKEEFERYPMGLSLSGLFMENQIVYTYEEYLEHLEQTKNFAREQDNYTMVASETQAFRNIQICILENTWAMISKNRAPAVHFVIRHPKMLHALENFTAPVFL